MYQHQVQLTISKQNVIYFSCAVLFCCLSSFASVGLKVLLLLLVCLPQMANVGYIAYSGIPAGCDELYKALTEFDDVGKNISVVLKILPFLLIPFALSSFLVFKWRKLFHTSHFFNVILVVVFVKLFHMAYTSDFLYAVPVKSRLTIINTMRVLPYCITHANDKGDFEYPDDVIGGVRTELKTTKTPRVILLLWGESTNADFLTYLGETRFTKGLNTTPNILKILKEKSKNFVALKAISGSVATRASTTLFFNLIGYPTNFREVAKSGKQNLFTLAKNSGYKTYWLSAFETNLTEGGGFKADIFISKDTHAPLSDGERDDYLLDKIRKIDISQGKHFIGIQFNACHDRYISNYANHKEFEKMKPNNNDNRRDKTRKEYINCIGYLDYLIAEVFKWGEKNGIDVMIYTSDHGEMLGVDDDDSDGNLFGHNYHGLVDAKVPFFIYQKNVDQQLANQIKRKKVLSHYEISKLVANVLGYEVKDKNAVENEFYLFSNRLFGNSIFVKKFERKNNGTITEVLHTDLNKFFKQYHKKRHKKQQDKR